jgi:hypothetical protein
MGHTMGIQWENHGNIFGLFFWMDFGWILDGLVAFDGGIRAIKPTRMVV